MANFRTIIQWGICVFGGLKHLLVEEREKAAGRWIEGVQVAFVSVDGLNCVTTSDCVEVNLKLCSGSN